MSCNISLEISQVADVKKKIETAQGANVYPAAQQMLIHQGKVLKDDTTLEENKVAENSFVVIMLSKVRVDIGNCTELFHHDLFNHLCIFSHLGTFTVW